MPRTPHTSNIPMIGSQVLLIVFLALSVILTAIYSSEQETGPLHTLQNGVGAVSTPFKAIGSAAGAMGQGAQTGIADMTADANTLSELQEQNSQLRQLVSELEEYRQEAQRLQSLQGVKDAYALESVTGRVVGEAEDSWNRVVTVDKGTNDGVAAGQPVVGTSGVVGQVISATGSTCNVRLLQDSQSGVAVVVQSSRAEGIVKGSVEGILYLEDIAADAGVQVGDVIITSGLGGSYFRGLMVGTVVRVEESTGQSTRTIVVSPNDSVDALQEVMIVSKVGNASAADSASSSSSSASSSTSSSSSAASEEDLAQTDEGGM